MKLGKSWVLIGILCFVFPPIGFAALIFKIIVTVLKNQQEQQVKDDYIQRSMRRNNNQKETNVMAAMDKAREVVPKAPTPKHESTEIDNRLEEAFTKWDHTRRSVKREAAPIERAAEVIIAPEVRQTTEGSEAIQRPKDLDVGLLEERLNQSTDQLTIDEVPMVDADIDLTITDVHIDTVITVDDPSDRECNHEGETPLKIVACTMCGTENAIYKIDRFETPTCEKCGMLLLNA